MSSYPFPYHQTTPMTNSALVVAIQRAQRQDEAVLAVFADGRLHSPSQVHATLTEQGKSWPLTSIRRAITNLENAGALVKTDTLVQGIYGRDEHTWRKA